MLKKFIKRFYFTSIGLLRIMTSRLLSFFGILVIFQQHSTIELKNFTHDFWLIFLPYGLKGPTVILRNYFFTLRNLKITKKKMDLIARDVSASVFGKANKCYLPTSFLEYRAYTELDFGYYYTHIKSKLIPSFTHTINFSQNKPILFVPPIDGFFHIFLEYIPEIIVASKSYSILITVGNCDHELDPFKFCGLNPIPHLKNTFNHVNFHEPQNYYVMNSRFPSLVSKKASALLRGIVCNHLQNSRNNLYVFITRNGNKNGRILDNENEILDKLSNYNFLVIDPGTLPLKEQVSIFSRAKVVIGAHGAALCNIISLNPKALLIELNDSNYVKWHFYKLARDLDIKYKLILGNKTTDGKFRVDSDLILRELNEFSDKCIN